MRAAVVVGVSRHDRDVGLWFRVRVQPDRPLHAHVPPGAKRDTQRTRGFHDRGVMRGTLRLGDDELAAEALVSPTPDDHVCTGGHVKDGEAPGNTHYSRIGDSV